MLPRDPADAVLLRHHGAGDPPARPTPSCSNPKEIAVSRPASVATTIIEGLALVAEHDKREALRRLIRTQHVQNALIFCNRKTRGRHPAQVADAA